MHTSSTCSSLGSSVSSTYSCAVLTASYTRFMLDGVLNPHVDWLDQHRHGSAKDRTAPSLLAAPSRLVCLFSLPNFNFTIPNANVG